MNFQHLAPVPTAQALLDVVFSRARQKTAQKTAKSSVFRERQRQQTTRKIDIIYDALHARLGKIQQEFPPEKELSPFYLSLLKITVDYQRYKQALGAVHWAGGQVDRLRRTAARQLARSSSLEVRPVLRQFYGRVSSFLKQINPALLYLEQCRQILRTYPDVKEMFTICIYGFPNVGKTTLLNRLAKTKARVAAYAFTTTSINAGYCTIAETKVQVLDVPGTLARPEKMNLVEQQAELVQRELAQLIIFVLDPTETSGFSLLQQEQLLQKISDQKKIIIYLSKSDLLPENERERLLLRYQGWPVSTSLNLLRRNISRLLPPSSPQSL